MLTAEEYRIAAKVAREVGNAEGPDMIAFAEEWEERAEQADHLDTYVIDLAKTVAYGDPAAPLVARGYRLIARLLGDGWTAPKGLF